jgi:hypothetical protein
VADEAAKQAAMQEYTADPLLWEGTLFPLTETTILVRGK